MAQDPSCSDAVEANPERRPAEPFEICSFVADAFSIFFGAEEVRPFTVFLPVVFMNEIYEPLRRMRQNFSVAHRKKFSHRGLFRSRNAPLESERARRAPPWP